MPVAAGSTKLDWKGRLKALLPLFGHRNWIVIADAAYPAQSGAGIETIVAGGSPIEAARTVLDAVAASEHIRAKVYLDQELEFVAETDAPGVSRYRTQLSEMLQSGVLKSAKPITLPHEQIIAKLGEAAIAFHVLIIKTELSIPYTTIFLELDCGYWTAEAEKRLRRSMAASARKSKSR